MVQPPLWACHSLTHSFTHSLPHSLIFHPLQLPSLQNSNTAPFWLTTSSPEQPFPKRHVLFFFFFPPCPISSLASGRPFSLWSIWKNGSCCSLGGHCLGFISEWATASQSLLVGRGHFTSAGELQWNSASGRDVAGRESPTGGVITRYDHSETTWIRVTAFVNLTAKKKRRGERGWLKAYLPSLCL